MNHSDLLCSNYLAAPPRVGPGVVQVPALAAEETANKAQLLTADAQVHSENTAAPMPHPPTVSETTGCACFAPCMCLSPSVLSFTSHTAFFKLKGMPQP